MNQTGISADTIVRTIVLALALLNQLLTSAGKNPLPFSDSQMYEGATLAVTFAAAVWAWWKNNSFTQAAILGDGVMKTLKAKQTMDKGDQTGE